MKEKDLEAITRIEKGLIKITKDYIRIAGELELYKCLYGELDLDMVPPKYFPKVIPIHPSDKERAKIMSKLLKYQWDSVKPKDIEYTRKFYGLRKRI